MSRPVHLWTYDEYATKTPEGHWELIDGVLYRHGEPASPEDLAEAWGAQHFGPTPGVDHQHAKGGLYAALDAWANAHGARAILGPVDVVLAPDTAVQPDVFVLARGNDAMVDLNSATGTPDLVVEVISPRTARHDAGAKLDAYGHHGVPEVWLVWPQEERVDVYCQVPTGKLARKHHER